MELKKGHKRRVDIFLVTMIAGALMGVAPPVKGAENPDELYKKGRFAEAGKMYARSDMDHPKDLRYRYNRGCAEYEAGDYKGAMAAFSSVLRRGEEKKIRFRAAYNLGNAAFKQGDVASAAEYYRQAIRIDPREENARYNLELALRRLKDQKKEKKEKEKNSGQKKDQKDSQQEGQKGTGQEKSSPDDSSEKDKDQQKDTGKENKGDKSEEKGSEQEAKKTGQGQHQPSEEPSPKDLSGELKPRAALPEASKEPEEGSPAASLMDKKRAEALLDNVTEDRSKFLRLQMPENRGRGAASGKDW